MTLREIFRWWRRDIADWRQARQPFSPTTDIVKQAMTFQARMCVFVPDGGTMGRMTYTVIARRGGFSIGRIEWRNQWGYYAFYPVKDDSTPMNAEILAEIHGILKKLGGDSPRP